jgi:Na+/proline symporter
MNKIRCGCKSCSIIMFISMCIVSAVGISAAFQLLIHHPILVILVVVGCIAISSIFDIKATTCTNSDKTVSVNDRLRGSSGRKL